MPKPEAAFAAALLLLASCGSPEGVSAENNSVAAEGSAPENASTADPAQPGAPANSVADPVPPPDAVSHPDGYLPPVPDSPDPGTGNSSGPDSSPPATEDEYIRNGQRGR